MSLGLRQELSRAFGWIVVGLIVWPISGNWAAGGFAACAGYLAMNLWRLYRLRKWLDRPKNSQLPEAGGLWGEAFDELYQLQRRNRRRKKRLASIVAEFQASTAALPDGAVVLSPRGEIVWFNSAAEALLGLRSAQDIGQRIGNLVRHPRFTEYFARSDYAGETEAPSPVNASVICSFRIIPYGEGQRLLIVRDVSELRRLDMARRNFVANASHELRTPLTVVRGYLDLLQPEARNGGALTRWQAPIDRMRTQVSRMEALINDLLKLARLESDVIHTRQEVIDVPNMLEHLAEEARAMSQGAHKIEIEVDASVFLFGRTEELQSVFSNLISNAVRYTGEGGEIRVRWLADNQCARFSVTDTGIGIAEADIPRITERFYRVDIGRSRASGGTGLGLSIVKHALELHEAHLEIESQVGVGSTFSCTFPKHRTRRREAASAQRAPSSPEALNS